MCVIRVGWRRPEASKMELFQTIVEKWKQSRILTKSTISDVTVVLDPVWAV